MIDAVSDRPRVHDRIRGVTTTVRAEAILEVEVDPGSRSAAEVRQAFDVDYESPARLARALALLGGETRVHPLSHTLRRGTAGKLLIDVQVVHVAAVENVAAARTTFAAIELAAGYRTALEAEPSAAVASKSTETEPAPWEEAPPPRRR